MQKLQLTFLLTTEDCINANKKNAFVTKISTMIGGKKQQLFHNNFFLCRELSKIWPFSTKFKGQSDL